MSDGTGSVGIDLLGDFSVVVDSERIADAAWPGRRAIELVQLLALSERRELLRDQVIDHLWPHLDPTAGASNLRKAAHHVRHAVGDDRAIVLHRGSVALFPDRHVLVDADMFERAASTALATGDPETCSQAAALWAGELLPAAIYEPWTEDRRRHLHRLRVDLYRTARRWRDVVDLEPTDESAYLELMRSALDRGARAAAIGWYGRLRIVLAEELGVRPGDASRQLYELCIEGLTESPQLIGRSVEIATVEALLGGRSDARVGAVAVRGPAGIGKTALCREAVRIAERLDWSTRVVRVEEGAAAYGPVIALIDDVLADRRDALEEVTTHVRSVLAALTPVAGPADPLDGPLNRHQVVGALQQLLDTASGNRPVLLVVDDVHLADDASLDVLGHIGSSVRDILVVAAHRDVAGNPALDRCVGRLNRVGTMCAIDLAPLPGDEIAAIVAAEAPNRLDDSAVARIVARADGNPFVATELARAHGGRDVPSTLSEAIVTRLVDLDADTMAVMQRLAIAADELDSTTVVALTGDTEESAFRILDRALDAGVLVVDRDRYRFRHEFVRQALVDNVAPHRRAAVHRDVAKRLAVAGAAAATIARHWLVGGRPAAAEEWLVAAAVQAKELGAFADACRYLADVLAHAPSHAAALRLNAESLDMMGEPAAVDAYDAAIAAAADGDRDDLVAMRALAQLKLGDPTGALVAIEGASPTSVAGRLSEALTYAGAAALGFADPAVGTTKAAECRRLALQSGDTSAIVVASWAHAAAAHARGELRTSVLDDLRDTKAIPHLAVRVFDGQLCITQRFLYGARPYDEVIAFADGLADEGARLGAARGYAFGVTLRGEAELLSGRHGDAAEDLAEGGRLHRAIGGATGEALALQRLAELAIRCGDPATAASLLADALDVARLSDVGFHLLDRIYGTRIELAADAEAAVAAVDEAEEAVRGPLETCPGCRITFAIPAAIACARAGQLDRAHAFAEAGEFLAHVVMKLPAWDAAYHEVLAHIARAEGDERGATERFATAADAFADAGHPWDRERCATLAATPST